VELEKAVDSIDGLRPRSVDGRGGKTT